MVICRRRHRRCQKSRLSNHVPYVSHACTLHLHLRHVSRNNRNFSHVVDCHTRRQRTTDESLTACTQHVSTSRHAADKCCDRTTFAGSELWIFDPPPCSGHLGGTHISGHRSFWPMDSLRVAVHAQPDVQSNGNSQCCLHQCIFDKPSPAISGVTTRPSRKARRTMSNSPSRARCNSVASVVPNAHRIPDFLLSISNPASPSCWDD